MPGRFGNETSILDHSGMLQIASSSTWTGNSHGKNEFNIENSVDSARKSGFGQNLNGVSVFSQ